MNQVGRPLKFQSVEELESKIDAYFNKTPIEDWTITGLAIALDTFRSTLCDYEDKDEYYYTIKKAKQAVEHSYEIDLKKHGRTGTIFALKNFDWKDKQEQEMYGKDGKPLIPHPITDVCKDNGVSENTKLDQKT